jgi:RTX calcium-binding nonapeptide repeat (4 copies)
MALGFNIIAQKTTFSTQFNKIVNGTSQKSQILAEMKKAYDKSTVVQDMFDSWIKDNPSKKIEVIYQANDFKAEDFAGKLFIDLDYLKGLTYIDECGEAVPYLLIQALTHEFGHALKGFVDPPTFSDQLIDYKGTNVPFVNTIWKQLGFEPMSTYFATAKSSLQQVGYQYTNYSNIDSAVNVESRPKNALVNWNTSKLSNSLSKDLLIGGLNANLLESGDGDDFLFGGAGDDTLDGGAGTDTAVYIGKCSDYKIWEDSPFAGLFGRQWKVKNKNGKYPGTDTLKNMERIQFDNNEVYELKPGGLKCQKNITFVIDATTNTVVFDPDGLEEAKLGITTTVFSQVEETKAAVSSLINAIFAVEDNDVEIGIVGFNDTEIGNPSQVILPFTTQDNFADRKAAALAAISSVTASDGGDIPETPFDGLKLSTYTKIFIHVDVK